MKYEWNCRYVYWYLPISQYKKENYNIIDVILTILPSSIVQFIDVSLVNILPFFLPKINSCNYFNQMFWKVDCVFEHVLDEIKHSKITKRSLSNRNNKGDELEIYQVLDTFPTLYVD